MREKMNEGTPYPEGMPNLPPLPAGYDYWEYVPEGLTGPQPDPWDRCKKDTGRWSGNIRPTPQGDATLRDKEKYWDIREVKRTAPKIKPISSTIVIDLPASAIVFTEDDGTPINQTKCAHIPKWVKKAPAKQSNIKYIEWDFSFGDLSIEDSFHIYRLPISNSSQTLIPTSTLSPTSQSLNPWPKTEAGIQYYCVMVCGEIDQFEKPPTELAGFIKKSLKEINIDMAKNRLRNGNNEAVLREGGLISSAIGHRYIHAQCNKTMKTRYAFQIVLEPSKLTML